MKKITLLLLSIFFVLITYTDSLATFTPPFWDGVLLANKSDDQISAFVDKTEQINELVIIANINGKTIKHPVKDFGRMLKVNVQPNSKVTGFIMVKKLGFVVASVKVHDIISSNQHYLLARSAVMKNMDQQIGYQFTSKTYTSAPSKAAITSNKQKHDDVLDAGQVGAGFVLKENRKNKRHRGEATLEELPTTEEYKEEKIEVVATRGPAKIRKASSLAHFEKVIYNSLFPKYIKGKKKEPTRQGVSVKKDALSFDSDYHVVKDHDSWLYLEHKRKSSEMAFDGEYLFEINTDYFDIQYKNEEEVLSFLDKHYISMKPHNKKLLGFYYRGHEIIALKSYQPYYVQMTNQNLMKVKTGGKTYTFYSDKKYLVVKENGKILHKLSKDILKIDSQFYYNN
ncbi:hypothetical protein MY04_4028 [Flammeovirga sp. MY04]|uniref:hypothetical protein n=1 Tax=Flammeovirga sp. MY04 TaxID=1191459 RepID=UPI0008063E66|nr:hypothetical protein [Flammeovirga sp. MY04]ANQ51372.1 hypothetical protein MY04_4028 [Flammeovirga sp. MY04]